jgi:hypothetical protein
MAEEGWADSISELSRCAACKTTGVSDAWKSGVRNVLLEIAIEDVESCPE